MNNKRVKQCEPVKTFLFITFFFFCKAKCSILKTLTSETTNHSSNFLI